MSEVQLTADGEKALAEAERLCRSMNVAIQAPEHILGGAMLVCSTLGVRGLPTTDEIMAGLEQIHGRGDEPVSQNLMPGSGARMALNETTGALTRAGETELTAAVLVRGFIASGEVNPMFYAAMGSSKGAILATLDQAG